MPLSTRFVLLFAAIVLALWGVFAVILYQRDARHEIQYNTSVKLSQDLAWSRIQAETKQRLSQVAKELANTPDIISALQTQDRGRMAAWIDQMLADSKNLRVDAFDTSRALFYTTNIELQQESLLETGALTRALTNKPVVGLSQSGRGRYYIVAAHPVVYANTVVGIIAVGSDARQGLTELGEQLKVEAFIANSRGREIAGTQTGLLAKAGVSFPPRVAAVQRVEVASKEYVAVSQPLLNLDDRTIGILVGLRDVTEERYYDRVFNWATIVGAGLFMVLLVISLMIYLRSAFAPLNRSIKVLDTLAKGELGTNMSSEDEQSRDEAGQIARGVSTLRDDMFNLAMLREERVRMGEQQARVIRHELRTLANNLDASSREQILRELEGQADLSVTGEFDIRTISTQSEMSQKTTPQNQLASLAGILGRMSGLVTAQQSRLIKTLRELQEALETKALFLSLQQELEIARRMQLSVLPRTEPNAKGVQVTARMIPAKEVGGDFYDYFMLDERYLAVVVADVSGKGVPAAFFMAISRTLIKGNAQLLRDPAKIISLSNDQLAADNEQMMFVTVFFGVLDTHTGLMRYVNAGHNPPVLTRASIPSYLPSGKNMALAVMDGIEYNEGQLQLERGDRLFMYTDGVTEAVDPKDNIYGEQPLLDLLAGFGGSSRQTPEFVIDALKKFADTAPQADDITCVSIEFMGS